MNDTKFINLKRLSYLNGSPIKSALLILYKMSTLETFLKPLLTLAQFATNPQLVADFNSKDVLKSTGTFLVFSVELFNIPSFQENGICLRTQPLSPMC